MGRKKKPFIDKKKATKFHLVPRSQADPLLEDPLLPQHVLRPEQPSGSALTVEERLAQQRHYGVHYSDDYDYLQHLKEPGTAVMEAAPAPDRVSSLCLPGEVFGSEVKMEGDMGKVLPVSGPQPDWDPEIVACLDDPDTNFDPDNQLEDDFVIQANGGEPGIPVYVTDTGSGGGGAEGDVWWMERGDFTVPHRDSDQSQSIDTDQSDSSSTRANDCDVRVRSKVNSDCERVATFTNYSISSSVVPRNKGLTQLDQRFEKFMSAYEDSELGAPEVEGSEGGEEREGEGGDQWLLELAVRDFERNFSDQVNIVTEGEVSSVMTEEGEGGEGRRGDGERGGEPVGDIVEGCSRSESSDEGESEEERGGREEREVVMVEDGKPEWDCESILSTYSNLYNHPTKIVEPSSSRPKSTPTIALSKKTGIPLGTITGPLTKDKPLKQMPVRRPRHETSDERRERKRAVKEERKFRRSEKKATKILFHSEQLRQEKQNMSHIHTAAVV